MLFWKKKTPPLVQSSASAWREQWRAIVPPECRNVPVTVGNKTVTAYVQINHFVMMLQDGLLMEEHFFDVCSHFQRAGYHVIWLMRCTQDIENGYLKLKKQRVQWAESSDDAQMVPSRTEFATVGVPGTPAELANWLRGGFMSGDL